MSNNYRPFIQWPGWSELRVTFLMALGFLFFFYLIYGTTAWLADFIPWRYNVGFEWEKNIPFIPSTAFIYLSLNLMMWLTLFVIRDRHRIWLLVKIIGLQILISASCYLLFPVESNFSPRTTVAELPTVFILADSVNLTNNQLPSLHVCFAVTMALALSTEATHLWLKFFLIVWATAIAISTMTMHEHNFLDVITGIMLAIWGVNLWLNKIKTLTLV